MKAISRALTLSRCQNKYKDTVDKLCKLFKDLTIYHYPAEGTVTIPCNVPADLYHDDTKLTHGVDVFRIDDIINTDTQASIITEEFDAYRLNTTAPGPMLQSRHLCIPTQIRSQNRTVYVIGSIRNDIAGGIFAVLETGVFLDECFQEYEKVNNVPVSVVVSIFSNQSIVYKLNTIRDFKDNDIHDMDYWFEDILELDNEKPTITPMRTPTIFGSSIRKVFPDTKAVGVTCTNADTVKNN